MKTLTVAILAGGQSRRMGQDKAMLSVAGEPLLLRTARIAHEALQQVQNKAEVLVLGREQPTDWPLPNVLFLPDPEERRGEGPLGAIATALEATTDRSDAILALGCDMPGLTVDAIQWLIAQWHHQQDASPGVIGVDATGKWHPLFAIYSHTCLPHLQNALQSGERAMKRVIPALSLAMQPLPIALADAVRNINTPEAYQEWLSRSETAFPERRDRIS